MQQSKPSTLTYIVKPNQNDDHNHDRIHPYLKTEKSNQFSKRNIVPINQVKRAIFKTIVPNQNHKLSRMPSLALKKEQRDEEKPYRQVQKITKYNKINCTSNMSQAPPKYRRDYTFSTCARLEAPYEPGTVDVHLQ